MKKTKWIILVNLILVSLYLVGTRKNVLSNDYKVNITIESTVPENTVEEVRNTLSTIPENIVNSFVENDWKIVLLNSFNDKEEYEYAATDNTVVGLIDFTEKTIIVKGQPRYEGTVMNIAMHELCHYIDRAWGRISESEQLLNLYETYKDGKYITYSYAGISLQESLETDIYYATSSAQEFFAEMLKDYLLHPEYLKENYNELYDFCKVLLIQND